MAMVVWDPLGILDKYVCFIKLSKLCWLSVSRSKNVGLDKNAYLRGYDEFLTGCRVVRDVFQWYLFFFFQRQMFILNNRNEKNMNCFIVP